MCRTNFQLSKNIGCLKFCFWNIHGQITKVIEDKFRDPEFLQTLENTHIVGFAELHTEREAKLKGFEFISQKYREKKYKGAKMLGV